MPFGAGVRTRSELANFDNSRVVPGRYRIGSNWDPVWDSGPGQHFWQFPYPVTHFVTWSSGSCITRPPRQARLDDIPPRSIGSDTRFPTNPITELSVNPCPERHIRLSDSVRDIAWYLAMHVTVSCSFPHDRYSLTTTIACAASKKDCKNGSEPERRQQDEKMKKRDERNEEILNKQISFNRSVWFLDPSDRDPRLTQIVRPDEIRKNPTWLTRKKHRRKWKFAVPYQNKLNMTLPYNTI